MKQFQLILHWNRSEKRVGNRVFQGGSVATNNETFQSILHWNRSEKRVGNRVFQGGSVSQNNETISQQITLESFRKACRKPGFFEGSVLKTMK